jgi:hypothetical protein
LSLVAAFNSDSSHSVGALNSVLTRPATRRRPIGMAPIGMAPIGMAPIGMAPIGMAPIGMAVSEQLSDQAAVATQEFRCRAMRLTRNRITARFIRLNTTPAPKAGR